MADRRKVILATCCGAHGLQDGLTDLLYVLLPILAQAFGLTYAQVGVIRAANRIAMSTFELPSGLLSERLGERILLVFGVACAGVGYLSLSVATGFVTVLLGLLVAGFGAAFQHSLCSAIITRTFVDGGRRAALGIYNSSGDVGKLTFAGVFTLAIGVGAAWRDAVVGFGLIALLAAALLYLVLGRLHAGDPPAAFGR